jgi:23S rRNA (cytosine1962-C5)-methyltransferase
VKRLPDYLLPNGQVLLCLNAPELDSSWLKEVVSDNAPQLRFIERLQNPITFPAKDEERSLKVFVYMKD